MRLIDADELEIDEIDDVRCYSILQVEEALTIQAVPIDVLDKVRAEIDGIEINGQVDEHTMFIRTGEQVKQMALDIIDKYTK